MINFLLVAIELPTHLDEIKIVTSIHSSSNFVQSPYTEENSAT